MGVRMAAAALAALAASCTVGPDYKQPQVEMPPAFQEAGTTPERAPLSRTTTQAADLSQWWTQFHDPQLEDLIRRGDAGNLDLQQVASRIRQAREQEIVAAAGGLPSVSVNALDARFHSNSNPLAGLSGTTVGGVPSTTNLHLYSAGFDASWELDIFGGIRRGVEAARANTAAAEWQLRDGEVSLSAEIANDYLALRAAQERLGIVRNEFRRQQDTLTLTQGRARTGFVTELDVNQQRTQVDATAAEIPLLEAQIRAMEDALHVLVGEQPEAPTDFDAAAPVPQVPTELPAGLPSELLRRRPDIRTAERQLAAATANVGVAVADLYPKFNLLGVLSFASNAFRGLGGLFTAKNFSTLGAGQVSWPLFEGGRLEANVRINKEQAKQAYLAYQKSVLTALQDSEDSLVRYTAEQRRLGSLQRSADSARSSERIALQQYRQGLVPFINVLTTETTLLNAQDQVVQSRQALAQDLVAVYKALGGGWSDADINRLEMSATDRSTR
ncbi:MAG: efflux transporter outer membrane subunit [Alphaproteobacteria bacterium]|nr:efflux transporter outer membrane subunit [Alphaproteobacteria bacterium]